MRALITGINGFVGGHLAEHLLAQGWEVWGAARQAEPALAQLRGRVTIVRGDLLEPAAAATALERARPDAVFHLAAQSYVPRSFDDPAGTLQTNILAQLNLFEAALRLRQEPLFVIASSTEIFGRVQPEELPLTEESPLRPVSPYAVSKVTQDLLAYQYHASRGLRTLRMRPFNHIGPRQDERFVASAFAAQIARIEQRKQAPVLRVGNLSAERDFTDVRDVVRAYELATNSGTPGSAYNIGSGRPVSVRRLLDILLALSEFDIQVEPDPARMRPSDVPRLFGDSARLRADTGWEPQIPLEQTLYDILEDWRTRIRSE